MRKNRYPLHLIFSILLVLSLSREAAAAGIYSKSSFIHQGIYLDEIKKTDNNNPSDPKPRKRKSPLFALWLSAFPQFTLISSGLMLKEEYVVYTGLLSVVLGGSAGHVYAGEYGRAIKQTLIRVGGSAVLLGGATLFTYGLMRGFIFAVFRREDESDISVPAIVFGALIGIAGFTIVGVSYVVDVFDSPFAAKRYNRRHGLESRLKLLPILSVDNSDVRVGLVGALNF